MRYGEVGRLSITPDFSLLLPTGNQAEAPIFRVTKAIIPLYLAIGPLYIIVQVARFVNTPGD